MVKKAKRILFVMNKLPRYRTPFIRLLYSRLKQKNYELVIILTHQNDIPSELRELHIFCDRGIGFKKFRIHPSILFRIPSYDLVLTLPPDPLHLVDNLLIFLVSFLFKKPFIVWTERWQYKKLPMKDRASLYLYRLILRKSRCVVVPGTKSHEWAKNVVGVKNVFLAPNASSFHVNQKELSSVSKRLKRKYHLKGKKVILFVGRLIKRKGVDILLKAFSRIQDNKIVLLVVGGGDFYGLGEKSEGKNLMRLCKRLSIEKRVKFTGFVKDYELPAFYSISHLLVVPSVSRGISEPWGLVINEAMQFGLPIVATDAVGGAYDLIKQGKNGFIVKEGRIKELCEAIESILKNEKKRRLMGKYSKKIISNFSYIKMCDGFLSAIENALGGK